MAAQALARALTLEPTAERSPHLTDDIRAAQRGDQRAFESLYRAHGGRVFALCVRLSGNRERAEVLTQDAFVRAWEMLPSFRGEAAFTTWMHRVTVNVVLRSLHNASIRSSREVADERLEEIAPSTHSSVSDSMDLEEAIAQLPEQARIVFVLHDVEGFTHEEIAEQLGIAAGTSKSQLHRARSLLREMLR